MDKFNWFFRQRVQSVAEMRAIFDLVEVADRLIVADGFSPGTGFLLSAVTVVEDSPQSQIVEVGAALGWDKDGKRVFKATSAEDFNFAGDEDPTDPRIASLYVKFNRDESNPRLDGGGNTVQFDQDEGFVLERDLGTPAGSPTPPAARVDDSIHIADVTIPAAAAVITDAEIDTTVQNLQSSFPVGRLKAMTAGMEDAMEATAALAPTTANRVALLSDAGLSQNRGYKAQVKIVTTGAAVPTDTIDVESAIAVDGAAVPDTLMRVRNAPLDLGAAVGVGALDVGVVANATYYIYLVGDSTGVTAANVVASLDNGPGYGGVGPSYANMPLHDRFRLIGVLVRDAGSIVPFRQINGRTYFDDWTLGIIFAFGFDGLGAAPTGFVALSVAPYCPPIAERVTLAMRMDDLGAAITAQFQFRSGGGPVLPGYTNFFSGGGTGAAQEQGSESHMALHVSATQTVDWQRFAGSNMNIEITVAGFTSEFHFD